VCSCTTPGAANTKNTAVAAKYSAQAISSRRLGVLSPDGIDERHASQEARPLESPIAERPAVRREILKIFANCAARR
jgi:hypothetical protein